jgi:hypothetical protein
MKRRFCFQFFLKYLSYLLIIIIYINIEIARAILCNRNAAALGVVRVSVHVSVALVILKFFAVSDNSREEVLG